MGDLGYRLGQRRHGPQQQQDGRQDFHGPAPGSGARTGPDGFGGGGWLEVL